MPTYTVPDFNLLADIYGANLSPPVGGSPRETDVPCQVYVGKNNQLVEVRFPAGTDIRHIEGSTAADWINAPAGSVWWYRPNIVLDKHRGFGNEYRIALCTATTEPDTHPYD